MLLASSTNNSVLLASSNSVLLASSTNSVLLASLTTSCCADTFVIRLLEEIIPTMRATRIVDLLLLLHDEDDIILLFLRFCVFRTCGVSAVGSGMLCTRHQQHTRLTRTIYKLSRCAMGAAGVMTIKGGSVLLTFFRCCCSRFFFVVPSFQMCGGHYILAANSLLIGSLFRLLLERRGEVLTAASGSML